jgi:cullin-5
MFRLLDRVGPEGIDPMLNDLENHIVSSGLNDMVKILILCLVTKIFYENNIFQIASAEIITQDSEKYVERLLSLFTRFSKLVKDSFNDDPRFLTARDKAFKTVVNDTSVFKLELSTSLNNRGTKAITAESRCPELLANFCDMLLRKTPLSKKLTSDQIETRLKDVLLVLKYISNKDVFMR